MCITELKSILGKLDKFTIKLDNLLAAMVVSSEGHFYWEEERVL